MPEEYQGIKAEPWPSSGIGLLQGGNELSNSLDNEACPEYENSDPEAEEKG
ncbi:MAG: hypothetical protein AAF226_06775 [Verrucomicrobiota bacterium]